MSREPRSPAKPPPWGIVHMATDYFLKSKGQRRRGRQTLDTVALHTTVPTTILKSHGTRSPEEALMILERSLDLSFPFQNSRGNLAQPEEVLQADSVSPAFRPSTRQSKASSLKFWGYNTLSSSSNRSKGDSHASSVSRSSLAARSTITTAAAISSHAVSSEARPLRREMQFLTPQDTAKSTDTALTRQPTTESLRSPRTPCAPHSPDQWPLPRMPRSPEIPRRRSSESTEARSVLGSLRWTRKRSQDRS